MNSDSEDDITFNDIRLTINKFVDEKGGWGAVKINNKWIDRQALKDILALGLLHTEYLSRVSEGIAKIKEHDHITEDDVQAAKVLCERGIDKVLSSNKPAPSSRS